MDLHNYSIFIKFLTALTSVLIIVVGVLLMWQLVFNYDGIIFPIFSLLIIAYGLVYCFLGILGMTTLFMEKNYLRVSLIVINLILIIMPFVAPFISLNLF